jgi:hypothetical protein
MWASQKIEEKRRALKNPSFVLLSSKLERAMGIEPTLSAWKAKVLPLNYARTQNNRRQKTSIRRETTKIFINARYLIYYLSSDLCSLNGGGRIRTFEGCAVRFTV